MNKILLIGCGHMGFSLLKSWSSQKKNHFSVVDPNSYGLVNRKFKKNIRGYKSIRLIKDLNLFDIVIFAVKPQIIKDVLIDFAQYQFNKNLICVSIVAGKKINFFYKFIPITNTFIRAMPNMPSSINEGMTCLYINNTASKKNKKIINSLFLEIGKTLWLKSEIEINKTTAISGSGPGYIFFFIDAFEKAALDLGLGKEATKLLVYQTFFGSIKLIMESKISAKDLANNIAVKGGTTEAGLKNLSEKKILHNLFKKVIKSSYQKANLIGK